MNHPDLFVKLGKNGYGVYASNPIKKGTILWWDAGDVKHLLPENFDLLTQEMKDYVSKFCTWKDEKTSVIEIFYDIAKFWNHSCNPNTEPKNGIVIAKNNIKKGEEVTCDYEQPPSVTMRSFDCNCGEINCRQTIKTPKIKDE